MLLRDICVSYNMEFFCRTNIKPRNALPVTLTVASMMVLDSKVSPMPWFVRVGSYFEICLE